ncbi:MAG: hypothetical protein ABSA47_10035 [Verrucomicrobiota bacterium]|jgi:hypothetical protein
MKQSKPAPEAEGSNKRQSGEKQHYRKPALKRLGMLKSVVGSGIHFGVAHSNKL